MQTHPRPRVAIVAASLDILGGQGVQACSLLEGLKGDGYDVMFVPVNPRFPRGLRWVRRVPYLRTLVNEALYLPSLVRLAGVDVVHVFSASYASFLISPVPAMIAARLMSKRVVLHYHSGEAADHLSRWGALVHPWLRLADEIVVPSRYLRDVFAHFGYETQVIPNVVDLSRFAYRERESLSPHLLSARNLEPYYGVEVILDAFARLQAAFPSAALTVAGYGSEEARLRARAASLGLRRVRFVGKIDPETMPLLYAEADIFVNASAVDNQPVSILEAFAAGLPVVSTPAGDIPSMVRSGGTGLLVPPNDPDALAGAVASLLCNPVRSLAIVRRARQDVNRHTWASVRHAWDGVYAGREVPAPPPVARQLPV